jgi:hypothetical protein
VNSPKEWQKLYLVSIDKRYFNDDINIFIVKTKGVLRHRNESQQRRERATWRKEKVTIPIKEGIVMFQFLSAGSRVLSLVEQPCVRNQ